MTSPHEPAARLERGTTPVNADLDPHERPLLFDRSRRGRMRVSGAKAAELLTGLVSNDVSSLAPGAGAYACALSPKGRIIADVRIYVEQDSLLIDIPERAVPGWSEMIRKYVNPRIAPYTDLSSELAHLGVFGEGAAEALARALQVDAGELRQLGNWEHRPMSDGVRVARSAELQVDGYDLFIESPAADAVHAQLQAAGIAPGSAEAWEIVRVEAGRPEWGIDIDDSTLAQEANMDALGAISYTKGCYVGQEVVARIHFRGHVNRQLRGLRFGHPEAAPSGSELFATDGKAVGDVRSSVHSPRFGPIALAMVRREVEPGTEIVARSAGGDVRVAVLALPFTA